MEVFLRNLLLGEKNELHNRTMHISGKFPSTTKVDIETTKVDIETAKVDIGAILSNSNEIINKKTVSHIMALYEECGKEKIFGRTIVEEMTGVKSSRASQIIKLLLENGIIEMVQGHGKGKYRFK